MLSVGLSVEQVKSDNSGRLVSAARQLG